MNSLLCCYFPTKVVFVDDDSRVLKSINSSVNHSVANYDFFTDPFKALELINSSQPTDFIASENDSTEAKLYDVYKAMYNPDRHNQVSTVIVDYQMPAMNGLEFCEKITNPYVQKILFTGIADEAIVIQAFNKGIIDGYIKKQDPNKEKVINEFVHTGQMGYFRKLTDVLVSGAFKKLIAEQQEETGFYDPVFRGYFEELVKKHNICEYYLNEPVGGFICLSHKGELSTIYAFTERTLDNVDLSVLRGIADYESPEFEDVMDLINGNQITLCLPFYGKDFSIDINSTNWRTFLPRLESIEGDRLYYISHVSYPEAEKGLDIYSFEQSKKDRRSGI